MFHPLREALTQSTYALAIRAINAALLKLFSLHFIAD